MSAEFARLYQAIMSDNQKVYSELRNSNTDVDTLLKETVKHSEDTLLHVAAKWKRHKVAEIIINLQPSLLFATNAKGETPLHVAATVGSEDVTRVIIDRCGQIEAVETGEIILRKKTEKKEETALHKAVKNGHLQVVKLLIDKDPELTKLVNKDGDSPLFMAVNTRHFEITHSILNVSDCSFKGRKNMNALNAAIACHATRMAEYLIKKRRAGLLEQQDDDFGWTPLHYAANTDATETIELLLSAEYSVAYIKDRKGMTALHIAAKQGHVRAVEKLVKTCPEICGIVDNKGRSFFHIAVKSGRIRVVRFILGKRYNLLVDAWVYILFPERPRIVQLLYSQLFAKVQVSFGNFYSQLFDDDLLNMQDYQENTVLHLAALEQHFFILFLLTVDRRFSKSTTNSDGLTVLDVIIQSDPDALKSGTSLYATIISGGARGLEQLLGRKKIKNSQKTVEAEVDKSGDLRQINLLVATIIATVSFTAALSVPGGFKNNGDEGTAVLAKSKDFHKFVIFNAIAFGLSVTTIISSRYLPRYKPIFDYWTLAFSQLATVAMVVAFIYGSSAVLGQSEAWLATYVKHVIWVCFYISMCFGQVFTRVVLIVTKR